MRRCKSSFAHGALVIGLLLPVAATDAQDWVSRSQDAMWVGAVVDQPLTSKTALWFDGSWRRMDFGKRPQQLLLRPGVQYTLTPSVRVSAGYAYIATAQYGALPIANPLREHRTWQQLLLTHRAGAFSFSHRYRLEQRWMRPLLERVGTTSADDDRDLGPTTYQNRLRYQGRGQINIPQLTVRTRPVFAFAWDELLMPLGGNAQRVTIGQNRATVGIGIPFNSKQRVEVGYMNLYNAFAARRANEINHTLWLSWHFTGTVPRRDRRDRAADTGRCVTAASSGDVVRIDADQAHQHIRARSRPSAPASTAQTGSGVCRRLLTMTVSDNPDDKRTAGPCVDGAPHAQAEKRTIAEVRIRMT